MSLAQALFSPSQARLYPWLFGQPERSYHLSELLRLTGLSSASLQRELKRLRAAGLIDAERVGNLHRFSANAHSPVFAELVSLTRKTVGMVPLLSSALAPLQPRLLAAWVYGSVAKQSDGANSDIDVMLVGDDLRLGEVLDAVVPLEPQLGRCINPTCYTRQEFAQRRAEPDSFVNRVLQQPTWALIADAQRSLEA